MHVQADGKMFCILLSNEIKLNEKQNKYAFDCDSLHEVLMNSTCEKDGQSGGHIWSYDLSHLNVLGEEGAFNLTIKLRNEENKTLVILLQRAKGNLIHQIRLTEVAKQSKTLSTIGGIKAEHQVVVVHTNRTVADAIDIDGKLLEVSAVLEWSEHRAIHTVSAPMSHPMAIFGGESARSGSHHMDPVLLSVLVGLVVVVLLMLLCIGLLCWKNRNIGPEVTLLPDKTTPDLLTVNSDELRGKSTMKSTPKKH